MTRKRTYDREGHAHLVTFSCDRRRRLLDHDRSRKVVLGVRNSQLDSQRGRRVGFVVMPDHVHAIVWFPGPGPISHFMKPWEQRSSVQIKRLLHSSLPSYGSAVEPMGPVWQARDYDFNLFPTMKLEKKLTSIHQNRVRAGLVSHAYHWPWSSSRYDELGRTVGVPVGCLD